MCIRNTWYLTVPNMNKINPFVSWDITTNTNVWKSVNNYSNLEQSHILFYKHKQHMIPDYCTNYEQNHVILGDITINSTCMKNDCNYLSLAQSQIQFYMVSDHDTKYEENPPNHHRGITGGRNLIFKLQCRWYLIMLSVLYKLLVTLTLLPRSSGAELYDNLPFCNLCAQYIKKYFTNAFQFNMNRHQHKLISFDKIVTVMKCLLKIPFLSKLLNPW